MPLCSSKSQRPSTSLFPRRSNITSPVALTLLILGACSAKQVATTGTQLPLQPARAILSLEQAPLSTGAGPALLVIDLPSRNSQTVPLRSTMGTVRPGAVSTGTQGSSPWGFALDTASGAIFGFDLDLGALGTPNRVLQLADVIPRAMAAGHNAVVGVSNDASSSASAVLWTASGAQRLSLFSQPALSVVCVASVSSGFAIVAAASGAAEVVLVDATGAVRSRSALPGDPTLPPLACNGEGNLLAIATTGQLLTMSTSDSVLAKGIVAALPLTLTLDARPRVAVAGAQTAFSNGSGVTLFNNASGASTPLAFTDPSTVVALASTADDSALVIGLGKGGEDTELVAYFFAQKEEIPIALLGSAQGLVDVAVAAEP